MNFKSWGFSPFAPLPRSQAATKGSRFRQLFRWRFARKEPAVAAGKSRLTPGESSGSGKDSAALEDSLEDGARLIRAPPPPELCFSDEEIDGVVPARRTGVWHRVWGGIAAAGRFLLRHWIKLLLLAAIITLIVLTAVKVRERGGFAPETLVFFT